MLYLSVCLSVRLSVCLSVYIYIDIDIYMCVYVRVCIYICENVSVYVLVFLEPMGKTPLSSFTVLLLFVKLKLLIGCLNAFTFIFPFEGAFEFVASLGPTGGISPDDTFFGEGDGNGPNPFGDERISLPLIRLSFSLFIFSFSPPSWSDSNRRKLSHSSARLSP